MPRRPTIPINRLRSRPRPGRAGSGRASVTSLAPWLLAGLLLAACENKPARQATEVARRAPAPTTVWQTKEWPMARGGRQLQGRVHDPVPKQPAIEWSTRTADGLLAEPAVAGGMLVFADAAGTVHALDLTTKEPRWNFKTGDQIEATPAIAADRVFIGSNDNQFRALDLKTGHELWHIESKNKFPTGAIVVDGPDPAATRILVNGYDGTARCLLAADGSEVWHFETESYLNGSPAVIDGEWVAFGGCDAAIHTVRLSDGKDPARLATDAQVITSVATFGTMVYAVNYANQLVAAAARATKPEWIYQADDVPFASAPAVDEKRVYVGSRDKHLHAIDRLSGKLAWKFKTGGPVASPPLVFDDAVVFGSGDGRLYAVTKNDGKEIWRLELGEEITAAPAFADGRLIVAGADGTLFSIKEKDHD